MKMKKMDEKSKKSIINNQKLEKSEKENFNFNFNF
jgi:hypothetical protein